MIKSVTVTNLFGESLEMVLTRPEKSGFVITKIEGLGPPRAILNATELASYDGSLINSSRLEYRNIVISMYFLEKPTIEDTRLLSYKYFPINTDVELIFETDARKCRISGRVETNEPDIFSKKEGCQISIVCEDPYFYSLKREDEINSGFHGVDPLFEFPFSNESLTDNLIEFGSILDSFEKTILYQGTVKIGVTIEIQAIGPATGFRIYNLTTGENLEISDERLIELVGEGIKSGDTITINTTRGEKGITLLRDGIRTNILNTLGRPIKWINLVTGENRIACSSTTGFENLRIFVSAKTIYEGI